MNNFIIKAYIDKLSLNDIYSYALKEKINISDSDANTVYNYIKNRWKDFLNNPENILSEIKEKVNKEVYDKILELYNTYKKRIIK